MHGTLVIFQDFADQVVISYGQRVIIFYGIRIGVHTDGPYLAMIDGATLPTMDGDGMESIIHIKDGRIGITTYTIHPIGEAIWKELTLEAEEARQT